MEPANLVTRIRVGVGCGFGMGGMGGLGGVEDANKEISMDVRHRAPKLPVFICNH